MRTNVTLEQALSRASESLKKKIMHSVELLRKAKSLALSYDPTNGYFLAFSGGKDSQALYHIAEIADVPFKGHMNFTSVDPPEVIRFVRQNYAEVEFTPPHDSIFNIAVKRGILPSMRVRWCCAEFKENAGAGKVTLIGIRHQESSRRAKRKEVEITNHEFSGSLEELDQYREARKHKKKKKKDKEEPLSIVTANGERTLGCIQGKESLLISPIIDWTEKDVWEFLNKVMQVPHCSLYDEGWKRIGCIGCPMSSPKQKLLEIIRYPHVKRNWIKAIKRIRMGGYYRANLSPTRKYNNDNYGYIAHPDPTHWGGQIWQQIHKNNMEYPMGEPTTECGTNRGFQLAHRLTA